MKEERRQAFFQADGNAAGRAGREGSEEKNEKGEDRSEKKRSRLRKGEVFAGFTAIFLIFAITLANIILPDKDLSEKENRMLSQFPELSAANLFDGRFMSHSESYLADQFMFRDLWISIRSRFQLLMGVNDSNGVYRGDRGYLFQA